MGCKQNQLHIFFLSYMVPGHMIPTLDLARLFANAGVQCTIVTTTLKIPFFAEAIESDAQNPGVKINLLPIKFPYEEADYPKENKGIRNFFKSVAQLQHPFGELLQEFQPNCLVADSQFSWANSTAKKTGIPCLSFDVSGYFYPCVALNLKRFEPHKNVSSDSELFVVPCLPDEVKLRRAELAPYEKGECEDWMIELVDQMWEAQKECYGVIKNSFYDLEPNYVHYFENDIGFKFKHWHIGPLFAYFKERGNEGSQGGGNIKSSIDAKQCLQWLDEQQDNSVIYICFGSMSHVADAQLDEIARALESLPQNFIFVVRNKDWALDGFEDRVKGRGLVIRGWAPQRAILDHRAVGGFMTHCGWNSVLEGVVAGQPLVTWPRHAEQFFNEKLVVDILRIGVPVGVKGWVGTKDENGSDVCKEDVGKAISMIMEGEKAEDVRKRAREMKEVARRAIQEGGSSSSQLNALIQELKTFNLSD